MKSRTLVSEISEIENVSSQNLFKAVISLAMVIICLCAICMIQVVLSFFRMLACASCCEGRVPYLALEFEFFKH